MIYIVLALISTLIFLMLWGSFYRKFLVSECTSSCRVDGKVAIISGASSGIGKETALALAERGARVILACRNLKKAQKVSEWINESVKRNATYVLHLDISDLDSVRNFAKEFLNKENELHILINNAGSVINKRCKTPQGLELTMATNYFGHFLLTNLLLGILKSTGNGRIINVSSGFYTIGNVDFEDLQFEKRNYNFIISYAQSKLCKNLFTVYLAKQLSGTGVTVNSLRPGVVSTEIWAKDKSIFRLFLSIMTRILVKTSKQGAQTSIYLSVADEVKNVTGTYFSDCKVSTISPKARDIGVAKKLWDLSEEIVKLTDKEKHL